MASDTYRQLIRDKFMSNKFQKFAQHNLCERKVESLRRKLHLSQDENQCNEELDLPQGQMRQDVETSSRTVNDEVGRSLDCAKRFQKLKSMRKRTEEKIQKNTVSSVKRDTTYIRNGKTHSSTHTSHSVTPFRRREQLEHIKSCQKSKGDVHVRNQNALPPLDGNQSTQKDSNFSNHCNNKSLRQKTLKQALALKMIEEAMAIQKQIKKMKEMKQQEHVNLIKHIKKVSLMQRERPIHTFDSRLQMNQGRKKKLELLQKKENSLVVPQFPIEKAMGIITKRSRNDRIRSIPEREMNDRMVSNKEKHTRFIPSPNYTVNDRT